MTELIRIPGPGDIIGGQFVLDHEIGRGGFGVVFLAKQLGVERKVAVKMLMPHAMTHEGVVERFKREARLASSLTHRNSVTIYAYGVHDGGENVRGLPYLAMEYLEGVTLHELMLEVGKMSRDEAIGIVKQALNSLAEAHRKGIIHRDIKPENIFIVRREDEEEVIKVLDFGIAKAVAGDWDPETRERLTRTGLVAGTAEYMAPEQATGQEDITPALDVYAVGCIMFQLLSGELPYTGNSPMEVAIKHISEPIPTLPPEYESTKVGEVVRRAMAKEPADRFRDATHFAEVLEGVNPAEQAGDLGAAALFADDEFDDLFEPPRRSIKPVVAVAVAAAVILLLVGVTAIALTFFGDGDAEGEHEAVAAAAVEEPDPEIGSSKEGDPSAPGEPVPDEGAARDDDPDGEDGDDAQVEGPKLADTVTVDSSPSASVWLGDESLGQTPIELARSELGDAPLKVTLKAKAYASRDVAIDWAALPEDRRLVSNLRKSRVGVKKVRTSTARPAAKGTKRGPKRKGPVLFDLNSSAKKSGGKKTSGKKTSGGNKKASPTLFAP